MPGACLVRPIEHENDKLRRLQQHQQYHRIVTETSLMKPSQRPPVLSQPQVATRLRGRGRPLSLDWRLACLFAWRCPQAPPPPKSGERVSFGIGPASAHGPDGRPNFTFGGTPAPACATTSRFSSRRSRCRCGSTRRTQSRRPEAALACRQPARGLRCRILDQPAQ